MWINVDTEYQKSDRSCIKVDACTDLTYASDMYIVSLLTNANVVRREMSGFTLLRGILYVAENGIGYAQGLRIPAA